MTKKYQDMSQKQFDAILIKILTEKRAVELLSIPGIYEIVSEEFNNEILDKWEKDNDIY